MKVLGLTGSIGMGKSTAAEMFKRMGVPVHDSDATVHCLLARGGRAVPVIRAFFGKAVMTDEAVDRQKLGQIVFASPEELKNLETILHPLVRQETHGFLKQNQRAGRKLVVLDIPLLFETGGQRLCDKTVVITAPEWMQRQRVMARPGMTEEKYLSIVAKQMNNGEKCRRADFVVTSALGRAHTWRSLLKVVKAMKSA